jgi:hypothetical protein
LLSLFGKKKRDNVAIYWEGRGIAIVFGLVLDPKGPWGVGIIEVASESEADTIGTNDPAVKAGLTFEIFPMPGAVVRK